MRKEMLENNPILKLTFDFALGIIKYCGELDSKKKFALSNQLIKSGTSIGANCSEAQNAESKPDFIHKFKIAAKEVDENQYWLFLCKNSDDYPNCDELIEQLENIDRIITKIIATSKTNHSSIR